jgi:hypothetical protein
MVSCLRDVHVCAGEKDLTTTSFYVVILSSCEFSRVFVCSKEMEVA